MSRFRVFLLLFVLSFSGGMAYGKALWWSIAGALFALVLMALLWAWLGVNGLRLARRTNTRIAQVGQVIDEEFRLTNLSFIPKVWVEIKDQTDLFGHYASRVVGWVGGKQWRAWRVRTRCMERGRFELGPITIHSGDPLGIYQMQRHIDLKNILLVHPYIAPLNEFPMPVGYLSGGEALRRRTHQITTNAASVREYLNGDSINRIHWGLSAKRGKLIVKEFELDPMSDVWILLDLHGMVQYENEHAAQPTNANANSPVHSFLPPTTEEYAVSVAASVAQYFTRQNRSVGFVAHAQHRELISAQRGGAGSERQLSQILETLSVIRAEGSLPFDQLLRNELPQIPRGSTVVAVSASPDVAWAEALQLATRGGLRAVAVVIDGESFGSPRSHQDLVAALAQAGAVVRTVKCGEPIEQAMLRGVGKE